MIKSEVESLIASEKVLVYSKTWCPYCKATKQFLAEGEVSAKIVELDQVANGDQM